MNNYPLTTDPTGMGHLPEVFQITELPGAYPRLKQYPQITDKPINYVYVQQLSPGFILHTNNETWTLQTYQIHLVTSVG